MKGKLIVITGIDGSGKTVQTDLLASKLKGDGYDIEKIDFPQYGKSFFADMIARYLQGDFNQDVLESVSSKTQPMYGQSGKPSTISTPKAINPYFTSLLYAGDRWECRDKIIGCLDEGKIVISNRYTCCNKAYQGAKISDKNERERFFGWVNMLEHKVYKIPAPDIIIFLQSDVHISRDLISKRPLREYHYPKDGLGQSLCVDKVEQRDIHEEDIGYMKLVEKTYSELASNEMGWKKIECIKKGKLLDKDLIAEEVWNAVRNTILVE